MGKRRVLIAIGGGIAAYKVCEVISQLFQAGVEVKVILTERARQFITPLTVSTLSRNHPYTDQDFWAPTHSPPLHIQLGEWADLLVIAPLTANTLSKLASGAGDNLLTNTVLASVCPVLLAPAMNTDMWEQVAVQRNWQLLQQDPRYHTIGPGAGLLACDRVGAGRMAEPTEIIAAVQSLLYTKGKRDLTGKRILISAGGTREHLDPVRFMGNPATGKMGVALARATVSRGGSITLVAGAMDQGLLSILKSINIINVLSATEMSEAMFKCFPAADWIIMSAAVGDVKPANYASQKFDKQSLPSHLALEPVGDILAQLGERKQPHQKLIGFAAQTGEIVKPALEKLKRKKLDGIVANPIDKANAGFGSDTNEAVLLDTRGRQKLIESCSKLELAHHILDFVGDI